MKVDISIDMRNDRVTARLNDHALVFNEPAVIGIRSRAKGRPEITGIGSDQADLDGSQVVPMVDDTDFRPELASSVARFIVMKTWRDLRPGLKGLLMFFDHFDVRINFPHLRGRTAEERRLFAHYLGYNRQITWWINDEKVKD